MLKRFLLAGLLVFPMISTAQSPIRLYDGPAPGSEAWTHQEETLAYTSPFWHETDSVVLNVTDPVLIPYLPAKGKETGSAIVVFPGGGFTALSWNNEGPQVAKWLADHGVAAFVLKYRIAFSGENHNELRSVADHTYGGVKPDEDYKKLSEKNRKVNDALGNIRAMAKMDAGTAVRYVREHSSEFGVSPDKIGIVGFSAGGALALELLYDHDASTKPNLVGIMYGALAKAEFPEDPCPLFIGATQYEIRGMANDLYNMWCEHRLPTELHSFTNSRHGFGYRQNGAPENLWTQLFLNFMKTVGFVSELPAPTRVRANTDWASFKRYEQQNAKLSGSPKVVLMGDSITDYWVDEDPGYFDKNGFVGRGIAGQTASQMLVRFSQDVLELDPSAVVLMAGTNDLCQQMAGMAYYPRENVIGNIKAMCELALSRNIKVLLCSVTPCAHYVPIPDLDSGSEIVSLNKELKAYADSKKNVFYVDYFTALANARNGLDANLTYDGIHPAVNCYSHMERILNEALSKTLKIKNLYSIPQAEADSLKFKKDEERRQKNMPMSFDETVALMKRLMSQTKQNQL